MRISHIARLVSLVILVRHTTIYKYVVYCANGTSNGGKNKQPASGGATPNPTANGDSQNKEPFNLNIKFKETTDKREYTKTGQTETYTAKGNHCFKKVYEHSKTDEPEVLIWETRDSKEYANKVEYDENNNIVTIHLGDKTKQYKKVNDSWTEETDGATPNPTANGTSPGQPSSNNSQSKQPVEIDIKKKKTTNQFTYTKSGDNNKIHTYEAKEGYGFNKVKFGNTNIWEASDSSQYASKVVFDESDSKNKTVTLTLLNSSTKKYKESGGNWTEEGSGDGSKGPSTESGTKPAGGGSEK